MGLQAGSGRNWFLPEDSKNTGNPKRVALAHWANCELLGLDFLPPLPQGIPRPTNNSLGRACALNLPMEGLPLQGFEEKPFLLLLVSFA